MWTYRPKLTDFSIKRWFFPAWWRKDSNLSREDLDDLDDRLTVNDSLHRQGIIKTFLINVLGQEGIAPLFEPDPTLPPRERLDIIRRAKKSWQDFKVNDREDTPWSLQAQVLASLVDHQLALIYQDPETKYLYPIPLGKLNLKETEFNGRITIGLDDNKPREHFDWHNVTKLEIPTSCGRYFNHYSPGKELQSVYDLQAEAYAGAANLLGLTSTLFYEVIDIPGVKRDSKDDTSQKLTGKRLITIPKQQAPPKTLDGLDADSATLGTILNTTTSYESKAYRLSNLAVTGDFEGLNYTSGLMAVQQDAKVYAIYAGLITRVAELIFKIWDDSVAKDIFTRWTEPVRPIANPVHYTVSMQKALESGAVSLADFQRGLGKDPAVVRAERQIEAEYNIKPEGEDNVNTG